MTSVSYVMCIIITVTANILQALTGKERKENRTEFIIMRVDNPNLPWQYW